MPTGTSYKTMTEIPEYKASRSGEAKGAAKSTAKVKEVPPTAITTTPKKKKGAHQDWRRTARVRRYVFF